MGDRQQQRTLHCGGCGAEEYHLRWTADGDRWLECAECGRPSSTVGIGRQKQLAWERRQTDE